MNILAMTARGPLAPAGTSAAPDGIGAQTNPYLGWQLLGYSRRRTNALLDDAANMIEQLGADVVAQRGALADLGGRLARAETALEDATVRLEASREDLARIRTEHARAPGGSDGEAVDKALVSAHREAAGIVARACDEAARILSSARADATGANEEADHLIEQAEIRAHALVEQAAGEAERLRSESEVVRERIRREHTLWTAFLRRALAAADGLLLDTSEPNRDLAGELRAEIEAAAGSPEPKLAHDPDPEHAGA
ncbi:MAG TPA: hypothetical protein VJ986_14195 [Gaiellaceae bacterium]|nr:hypothetical protein [Gaiellaceae bacterium]